MTCACGEQIPAGTRQCPRCEARHLARGDLLGETTGPLPPEGASLIVRRAMVEQSSGPSWEPVRPPDNPYPEAGETLTGAYLAVKGWDLDDRADRLAEVAKVERDRNGNVVWDWRYALWGGVIVALAVVYGAWWVVSQIASTGIDVGPQP